MRRLQRDETLHGTGTGQLAIDGELARRFELTEREACCATLVKRGDSVDAIAERLAISRSTAEKHLRALRLKLGVRTTREAGLLLTRLESEQTADLSAEYGMCRLVENEAPATPWDSSLEGIVGEFCRDFHDDGARALFYLFFPLSAATFRKGDAVEAVVASRELIAAYEDCGGWSSVSDGKRLFEEPDRAVVVDIGEAASPPTPDTMLRACRSEGLGTSLTVGAPVGTGYVVASFLFKPLDPSSGQAIGQRVRAGLLDAHSRAYAFGALARTANLSMRERDALALLAEGHSTGSAAEALGISVRSFGQLSGAARSKLGATTTAEAIAKAMALNALVFL